MSRSQISVFVNADESSVKGGVIQMYEPHNVIHVGTGSTDLTLHFDNMEQLDEFVRRISTAAQQVWEELHPDEQKVPIVGGIDLS